MGVGIPVIPIVYKTGLKLPTALAGLDRLDFISVAKRPWEKLVSRVREVLEESKVTSLAVRSIGVEKIFTSRHDFLRTYSLKTTLSVARDNSELLVVGRSLEAWAREFHSLRAAIVAKGLHVKMAVVSPNLPSDDWMAPGDYASLDIPAAVDKFRKIQLDDDASTGSFELYYLPNSPIFSFTYFKDMSGPCGVLELGANLDFDERFSVVFRPSEGDAPGILSSLVTVYKSMIANRQPAIKQGRVDEVRD
jgi:hypothetical protein